MILHNNNATECYTIVDLTTGNTASGIVYSSNNIIERENIGYATGITLNLESKEQKRFVITGSTSGDTVLSFVNTDNIDFFSVDFSANTTVNFTMPATVYMQTYEVDNDRWNSTTKVLTVAAGLYTLTFSYANSVYRLNCSDIYV